MCNQINCLMIAPEPALHYVANIKQEHKEDSKTGWYWLLGAFGISLPKQDKALSQYWFASLAKEWDLKLVMAWLISISFLHVGQAKHF